MGGITSDGTPNVRGIPRHPATTPPCRVKRDSFDYPKKPQDQLN